MKNYVLFLCVVFGLLSFNSCNTSKQYYQSRELFRNHLVELDSTKYCYLIDSISFDSLSFSVVLNKEEDKAFYIPTEYLMGHEKITDKTSLDKNYAILCFSISNFFIEDYGCPTFNDEHPGIPDNMYQKKELPNGWGIYDFKIKPSYMRVYIIRGDFFNYLRKGWMDVYYGSYNFPYNQAFYKVVVPVW